MKTFLTSSILVAALAAMSATAGEVDKRQRREQRRINQGVASGQMTQGEAARAERRDAAVGKEIAVDRAANGGTLSPAERRKINRQQNRNSRVIGTEKHNNKTAN